MARNSFAPGRLSKAETPWRSKCSALSWLSWGSSRPRVTHGFTHKNWRFHHQKWEGPELPPSRCFIMFYPHFPCFSCYFFKWNFGVHLCSDNPKFDTSMLPISHSQAIFLSLMTTLHFGCRGRVGDFNHGKIKRLAGNSHWSPNSE